MEARVTETINKQSLESQAVDLLRRQILHGELTAGERLLETPIAERLGLSRGTIRAAECLGHLHQIMPFGLRDQPGEDQQFASLFGGQGRERCAIGLDGTQHFDTGAHVVRGQQRAGWGGGVHAGILRKGCRGGPRSGVMAACQEAFA